MLLGSIVASTDAAAIFAVLRGSTLRRRLARTLEGEAGFNDPSPPCWSSGFIDWIQKPGLRRARTWRARWWSSSAIGLVVGLLVGRGCGLGVPQRSSSPRPASTRSRRSPPRPSPSAWPRSPTGRASSPSTWPGSMLGSARIPAKRSIVTFHEGLAWVAQLITFLTLGLLVFPSQLGDVCARGDRSSPCSWRSWRVLLATYLATVGAGFTPRRADRRWAGRACAGRSRWSSPRSR